MVSLTRKMRCFLKGPKVAVTCLVLVLCAIFTRADSSKVQNFGLRDPNQTFFVSEIFRKYGNNDTMTYEGFEHLLENLGLGKLRFDTKHDVSIHKINGTFLEFHDELSLHKHNHSFSLTNQKKNDAGNTKRKRNIPESESIRNFEKTLRRKCLTIQDILSTYGLEPYHEVIISPSEYLQICPAIVYELDQKLCDQEEQLLVTAAENPQDRFVWLYASISIFVMGASGVLCALVVPLVKKRYFKSLLQFLISLAAGTLCGDSLIHLIPQIFSNKEKLESSSTLTLKGTVILLAMYVFFIVENFLRKIYHQKNKFDESPKESGKMLEDNEHKCHVHAHGNGVSPVAWMTILGDILHNVTDGLSIGAAFRFDISSGVASSIAVFCHELPHELGDYAILLASGMSIKKSVFYNLVSTLFSFLGMCAGVLLGEIEGASLWINSFTAGSFLYIALSDLVPELKFMDPEAKSKNFFVQALGLFCGGMLMFIIALYESKIENLLL